MARLVIKGGTGVDLEANSLCVVGRLQSCGLQLKSEPQSSRKHFEVQKEGPRWILHDLGSRNGTLLNGERVQGTAPLTHGDKIKVGETVVEFESAPPSMPSGASVGSCKIEERIGRSAYGVLYAGTQGSLEREVIIEVVDPDLAEDTSFRERYQSHARLAGSFDHPRIQAVYDTSQGRGPLFTIYEACPGPTLAEQMKRAAFDPQRALSIVSEIASGLEHIHGRGKRHGALTPERVILARDGVKLTGAGEENRLTPHRPDRTLQAAYASPEEAQGAAPGSAADVYSLGVIAYRLLSGSLPYTGKAGDVLRQHASAEPIRPPEAADGATSELLGSLLAKAPSQRPAASEVVALLNGLNPGPQKAGAPRPRRKKGSARGRKASARNRQVGRGSSARNRALSDSAARRAPAPAAPAAPASDAPAPRKGTSSSHAPVLAKSGSSERLKSLAPSRAREGEPEDATGVLLLRLLLLGFGYLLIGFAGLLATRIALRLITPA